MPNIEILSEDLEHFMEKIKEQNLKKKKKYYINEWSVLVVLVRGKMNEIYVCSDVVRVQMSP